jgi:hypothetical protein
VGGREAATDVRRWLRGLLLLAIAIPLDAGAPLTMSVTPSISMAPSTVRIQMRIEPDASNRALSIAADSGGFYRSSTITIDGEDAPRTFLFEYRGLPGGSYVISGELSDNSGHVRAVAKREVVVIEHGIE